MVVRRTLLLLAALAAATACGTSAADGNATVPATVGVGSLPSLPPGEPSTEPTSESTTIRTTTPLPPDAQVGALVGGNRVILIGDSVMASTSSRYTNDMCEALVPLGWQVEVDAETARFIEFGNDVLDERLPAGWDAAVILLGNNYRNDRDVYMLQLDRMIVQLSPQPVVLLTVSEFTESRREVNDVIFDMAEKYDNVIIVDWGATTAADDSLTGGDGLHLTDHGRAALAEQVALAMGPAPVTPGECLDSEFEDDSGGSVDGDTTTTTSPPSRPNRTSTTVAKTTTTQEPDEEPTTT